MGKHGTEFKRVERDLYPTPPSVVGPLAQHLQLKGKTIWEFAAGPGTLATGLEAAGARVYRTDKHQYPGLHERINFLSTREPRIDYDGMTSNPPFGEGGRLAVAMIEAGLRRLTRGRFLALLLPADFDSGITRPHLFGDCPAFRGNRAARPYCLVQP
jgi:hypothetical protein